MKTKLNTQITKKMDLPCHTKVGDDVVALVQNIQIQAAQVSSKPQLHHWMN
jgi:hypothetical protein